MQNKRMQKQEKGLRTPSDIPEPDSLKVRSECGEIMVFRHLVCDSLPEEYRLKAREELNETEENARKGVRELKNFLAIHNLPSPNDDYFLMQFLRCQKFNFKNSAQKLKAYMQMKEKLADFVASIDLQKMRILLDSNADGFLPYRDKHGRMILFSCGRNWDSELVDIEERTKCFIALLHFAASFPPTSVNGFCYIGDASFRSFHDLYSAFYAFIKYTPHLIHLHGSNLEGLQDAFHPSILPEEFGGTLGPLNNESYRDRCMDFVERFKAECAQYGRTNRKPSH